MLTISFTLNIFMMQVPQYLLQAGYGKVACTQPRRISAMGLCRRVSADQLTGIYPYKRDINAPAIARRIPIWCMVFYVAEILFLRVLRNLEKTKRHHNFGRP